MEFYLNFPWSKDLINLIHLLNKQFHKKKNLTLYVGIHATLCNKLKIKQT